MPLSKGRASDLRLNGSSCGEFESLFGVLEKIRIATIEEIKKMLRIFMKEKEISHRELHNFSDPKKNQEKGVSNLMFMKLKWSYQYICSTQRT